MAVLVGVLLVVLAVGPVVLSVVLSRRPVALTRPDGMQEAAPSVMRTYRLSVAQYYEVEAAVQEVRLPPQRLFPAAQQLARQQLAVPVPTAPTTLARLQCALGATAVAFGLVADSRFAVVYGVLYAGIGGFSLGVAVPREHRRRERVRAMFRTDEPVA